MSELRNSAYRHLEVSPIAGTLGAEVTGVDLSRDLSEEVMGEIRRALLDNLVIFFRDQKLTPARQLAFARRWGDIHLHPFMQGMEDYPEVLEIKKTPADKKNFGGEWHSDQAFTAKPAMGTILYGVEIPSAGGDTLFTNLYAAYEALSPGMKQMLAGVKGVYRGNNLSGHDGQTREQYYAGKLSMKTRDPGDVQTISTHPLVRTHPETGRKALYVGGHLFKFEDMTEAESRPLIDFLMQHATRPEFTCRFRWNSGSLAFWDNRCTMHFAINDYPAETRIMHRVTVCGDTPY
ncbi:TauD/TfdA family dioxygenase [Siccirubricoccus sp. KC 17139]|uniref:TauD/TfdA family dioxygenase n=1 Tax=Siccirubricoccus soli TaxID=2899147 RepID=A0ABT1D6C5_9PROT|nr:TauD/TfdA family dioxygenase [Siccirubricoccus soli]MCO6417493.1 TauD/TfdA family dioxygenase [Siccirubricoccus soli]MCP2683628.1 TauD/TfdA family dioxygenase [Siccirubricoccus soli]